MRLAAEIWVKAYVRRCMSECIAVAVVRRGHREAGAIYLKVNRLDGTACLWGPGPAGLAQAESDRLWTRCHGTDSVSEAEADRYLERQISIDPDVWVVEVEDREGRHFLDEANLA